MLYNAFLSYSHAADGQLAPALQTGLQQFAKPWNRLRAIRVFRDKTGLSATPGLWTAIEAALDSSEYFVLLASPAAAQSHWVQKELECWLAHRPAKNILVVLTDGEIVWDVAAGDFDWNATTALPRVLRGRLEEEPLWVDMRWARKSEDLFLRNPAFRDVAADLSSALRGIPKDQLTGEDVRQHRKAVRLRRGAIAGLAMLALALALAAFVARENQRRAEENAAEARRQSERALARQLAIQASSVREEYPERAVLLAAEALRTSAALDRMVPEAEQSLRDTLTTLSGTPLMLPSRAVGGVMASRDAQWLLAQRDDQTAELWRIAGPDQPTNPIILSGYSEAIESFFVSRNGRWTVTLHKGKRALLWDVQAARKIAELVTDEISRDVDLDSSRRWLSIGGPMEQRLWDIQDGDSPKLIYDGYSNGGSVDPLAMSPDGRWFAAVGYEKRASEDREASRERGQKVILLDLRSANPSGTPILLPVSPNTLRTVLFTPDGRWLIAAGDPLERGVPGDHPGVYVWESSDFVSGTQPRFTLKVPNSTYRLAVSPDSRWLATGVSDEFARDRIARVWDLNASDPSATPFLLAEHQGAVHAMAFSSDSRFFATGAEDKLVRIWDLQAENPAVSLRTLRGLDEPISTVTFDAANKYLAAFERNGRGRFWDLRYMDHSNGTMLFAGQEDVATRVVISGDNRWVISSGIGGAIQRWELSPTIQPPMATMLGRFPGAQGVIAVSSNGRWLASATGLKQRKTQGTYGQQVPNEHTVNLWDFETRDIPQSTVLYGHESPVRSVAFSADNRWLISGSSDGKVRILELAASGGANVQHELKAPDSADVIRISPDQRWLATVAVGRSRDTAISLWSRPFTTDNRQSVLQMQRSNRGPAVAMAFSPDSRWLAAANAHQSIVRLWDMSADDPSLKAIDLDIRTETKDDPSAPWKFIDNVAFSPDSRWLAVVHNHEDGKQGAIWLWDLSAGRDAGRRPVPLRGHEGYISDLMFSPDGERLASASTDLWGTDNTVRIWYMRDPHASVSPIVLRGNRAGVSTVAFSPDGRWLIGATEDGTLQRWPMTTRDLLERAREAVGRNLTVGEWSQYFGGQEYRKTFEAFPSGK